MKTIGEIAKDFIANTKWYPCIRDCGAQIMRPKSVCGECELKEQSEREEKERTLAVTRLLNKVFGAHADFRMGLKGQNETDEATDAIDECRPLWICGLPGSGKMGFAVAALRYKLIRRWNGSLTQFRLSEDGKTQRENLAWVILPPGNWASVWNRLEQQFRETPLMIIQNFGWTKDDTWESGVRLLELRLKLFPGGTFVTSIFTPGGIEKNSKDENREFKDRLPYINFMQNCLPELRVINLKP